MLLSWEPTFWENIAVKCDIWECLLWGGDLKMLQRDTSFEGASSTYTRMLQCFVFWRSDVVRFWVSSDQVIWVDSQRLKSTKFRLWVCDRMLEILWFGRWTTRDSALFGVLDMLLGQHLTVRIRRGWKISSTFIYLISRNCVWARPILHIVTLMRLYPQYLRLSSRNI